LDIQDIDTPALVIDLDAMERNIASVAGFFRDKPCKLRFHAKFCKTPIIAHKVLRAGGARGICTAKLSEAEVMASAGIDDIFVTNEIVTRLKVQRLSRLSKWCDVKVAVDNPINIEELSRIAQEFGTEIGVLVDLNLSQFGKIEAMNRCGVLPGKDAVSLAKKVVSTKGLKFMGLMGFEGSMARYANSFEKRKEAVHNALRHLIRTGDMVRDAGINVEMVSAGCTANWNIAGAYPGVTEVQAGSYALMDVFHDYDGIQVERALTVLSTIISTPYQGKAIADVGLKGITMGPGGEMPQVKGIKGVEIERLNVEHAHLIARNISKPLRLGDRIELYPYVCDDTVNLYDKFHVIRGGKVVAEWQIVARGKSQ
jgi:3-hydroxy-D-aspartate aldolase